MNGGLPASKSAGELAELRRRAYGPHPDIWDDIAAQQRLRELEQQQRPQREPDAEARLDHQTASAAGRDSPQDSRQTELGIEDLIDAASVPTREHAETARRNESPRSRRRRLWVVGVVALVIGGLAGGALVSASIPRADLVLETTNDRLPEELSRQIVDWGVGGSGVQGHESLGELTAWTATSESGDACMVLVSQSTIQAIACAPGGLHPSVDVVVGRDVPVLGPEIPDGSALRLIAGEDGVAVWAKEPSPNVELTPDGDEGR